MTTDTNVQTSAPGPGAAAPASGPLTPAQASVQLEQLRTDRLAGKVLQDDYLNRADYLARIAAGEQAAAPTAPPATIEERFEQQYSEVMKAPEHVHEYGELPRMAGDDACKEFAARYPGLDFAQELDSAAREAFAFAEIPSHLAAPLIDSVNRTSHELAGAGSQDVTARLHGTASALQGRWGEGFKARFDGVVELVCRLAEGDPLIGYVIDEAPHLIFASEAAMEYLGRIADHRAKAR